MSSVTCPKEAKRPGLLFLMYRSHRRETEAGGVFKWVLPERTLCVVYASDLLLLYYYLITGVAVVSFFMGISALNAEER